VQLHCGSALIQMRAMPEHSVDAVVTDPPYGLSFMGKRWDYDVPAVAFWAECLRLLKPGGHLLAFAGTRTQHRMAVKIEDAGFEIRDMIAWVYGSGFPKSLDVAKAIDKVAGVTFEAQPATGVGFMTPEGAGGYNPTKSRLVQTGSTTEAAKRWQGWGTALKPALEPITVARKPIAGPIVENVLNYGTGALNIDGCRVGEEGGGGNGLGSHFDRLGKTEPLVKHGPDQTGTIGRWPANLIHDGSEEVLDLFPDTGKSTGGRIGNAGGGTVKNVPTGVFSQGDPGYGDSGSAARFFYCAKASKRDRDDGLDSFDLAVAGGMSGRRDGSMGSVTMSRNIHPTVKPTALMRYLVRLVTPPGGVVLDPFMGSGTTGKAAVLEGFRFVGIDRTEDYLPIARARIAKALWQARKGRAE
jgi:site-specific DNA-methyltransferase (adenine-specific)